MFSKVLIANRGEIAVRVVATLRALGIASVAVYSTVDESAAHVRAADEAVFIGAAPAVESYLNVDRIVAAALACGAQAVHPGYGFLAENAGFARACAAAGLVFIGPPPTAIEAMGDKIAAKATVAAAGVPVVPGVGAAGMRDEELIASLSDSWFPVLIKPSAGGGGKGMRVVSVPAELPDALTAARRTAAAAFGDGTLLVERYIDRPRHIEIQVMADAHGNVVHLGERECSLQRRHQKIIEEAPSPLLNAAMRAAMGGAAAEAARSVGYAGAGTVEFIVSADRPEEFYFMEMNTRLQVEHPVTELVTGLDLVELQLRVAAGERLPLRQEDVRIDGHAVEARVYAEDPGRGFLPTGGTVRALRESAGPHVRTDSGLVAGGSVTSAYDPMLSKVIAWGADRLTALRRLDTALADTTVLGVTTNIGFLRALLRHPDVAAGRLDTGLVERNLAELTADSVPDEVFAAAALSLLLSLAPDAARADPWAIPDGWRVSGPAWTPLRLACGTDPATDVRVRWRGPGQADVAIADGAPVPASAVAGDGTLLLTYAGRTRRFATAREPGGPLWLGRDGRAWALTEQPPASARRKREAAEGGTLASPMPGTVLAVHVALGQAVAAGQPVLVVEAMKMEHTVTAPLDGVVRELTVKAGQQVGMDEPLAVIAPEAAAGSTDGGS
jgi:acetyl-CoA/propionyl-CoA carboxylase, biotin carboxylase, biotin carboxyl carrier protein